MASELRRWLQKFPHPHSVRGFTPDDEERRVKIGTMRSKWRDAEEALDGCAELEALDGEDNVLRVFKVEGIERRGKPVNAELVEMSRLLNDAHNQGAQRSREAYSELVGLVKLMSERLAGLERAWHRLIMSMGKDAVQGGDADDADSIIKQLVIAKVIGDMGGDKSNGAVETEGVSDG